MTVIHFEYKQPAIVTVSGCLDVPPDLLTPGREAELKQYITVEGAEHCSNMRQDIDFTEHPKTVDITRTEHRTI